MGLSTPEIIIHHAGDNQGFRSIIALLPYEKLSFVIMANGSSFDSQSRIVLTQQVIELLLETKYGVIPVDEPDIFIALNDDVFGEHIGSYSFRGQPGKVVLENGQLYLHLDGVVIELKPLSETLFKVMDAPVTTTIEFQADATCCQGNRILLTPAAIHTCSLPEPLRHHHMIHTWDRTTTLDSRAGGNPGS